MGGRFARAAVAAGLATVLLATSLISSPLGLAGIRDRGTASRGLRPELAVAWREIFSSRPDPNCALVEWLRPRLRPGDEILVNYEDIPLMF